MRIRIDKDTVMVPKTNNTLVLESGDKVHSMDLATLFTVLRTISIVAIMVGMLAVGQYIQQVNVLQTAYLSGKIMSVDGPKMCMPSLDKNNVPYWDCDYYKIRNSTTIENFTLVK